MEALKRAVAFLVGIVMKTEEVLEDGKVNFSEILSLGGRFVVLPNFLVDIKQAWPTLKEVTKDEATKSEFIDFFKSEFDMVNDKAEMAVEVVFEALLNVTSAIQSVIAIFKK